MATSKSIELRSSWPLPSKPRPIVVLGTGGIVKDAHLPAYKKAGFEVAGVFDLDRQRAEEVAETFNIPRVFDSLDEAVKQQNVVFDVAVPPEYEYDVVTSLPPRSTILLQKPMGKDLADARRIRDLCRERDHVAAVNFQLRFSPMMLAIREAVDRGMLGRLIDIEFHLNLMTPWELFPFLKKLDRVEIQVHSIHYLDLIRSFLGEPNGVYAQTVAHPDLPDFKSTRSTIILDYGDDMRVALSINHCYSFGPENESASARFQGLKGAAVATLGLLLDYPRGKPEAVRIACDEQNWRDVPIDGCWFPDAFVGTMSNLQRFAAGEDEHLVSHYEDAYRTMALVEACYISNQSGATPIPE